MSDDATDGEKVIFILCEWTAGTLVYFSILDLRDGKTRTGVLFAVFAILFAVVGVKWPYVKAKLRPSISLIIEGIAGNRLYRRLVYSFLTIALLLSISIRVYRHYHGAAPASQRVTVQNIPAQRVQVPTSTQPSIKPKKAKKRLDKSKPTKGDPATASATPPATSPVNTTPPNQPAMTCTGSNCVNGTNFGDQTINNFSPPLPQIQVTHSLPIAPKPIQGMNGLPIEQDGKAVMSKPGAEVIVTLRGTFYNPAFVADCDVPCAFSGQMMIHDGSETSNSREFEPLSRDDRMSAGVVYRISQMYPGTRIRLTFTSLNDKPLTLSNVRPYAPSQ